MAQKQSVCAMVLKEEHVYFGGMGLTYRLSARSIEGVCQYSIGVGFGSEYREMDVGQDLELAVTYYRSIVSGRVTPCALEDVLQDLCNYA